MGKRRKFSHPSVVPTRQPTQGSDPEGSVASRQQAPYRSARKLLPGRQRQRQRTNAVETHYTGLGAQPEITVGRLRDRVDRPIQESAAKGPRVMRVLDD